MLGSYINCEDLIILTYKLDSKTIVLRCFINCNYAKVVCVCVTYKSMDSLTTGGTNSS